MSQPYWLGTVPQTVSQVLNNELTTTVNNNTNVTINVVPTVVEDGVPINRKATLNGAEATFVTMSNVVPGFYMASYAFNSDANGAATFGSNDTLEYYINVGASEAVYNLIRPNFMDTDDASEDVYITGCAGFSNDVTQNLTLNAFYTGASAGISTTCLFATLQKIG